LGDLTTHVLDLTAGAPAAGVMVELHELLSATSTLMCSLFTGADGRSPRPLIDGPALHSGRYSLTFHVAEYFRSRGIRLADPPFLEEIVVRIGISRADEHYHVPLLISPWSYSVYRGG